ncbi:aldose 1-epimerase [soil metagenome]
MPADAVDLSAGPLEATFHPDLGMVGSSLRHRGRELLALPHPLTAWRDSAKTTGLPLLAPWANRLSGRRYAVGATEVELAGLELPTDPHGLPFHGTLGGGHAWEVVEEATTHISARFDYGASSTLLRPFPFRHLLTLTVRIEGRALVVTTTVEPTGDVAVPVSFGFHPYLRLPGGRHGTRLHLPDRRHLALDGRGLPTDAGADERAKAEVLGERVVDDLYELGAARSLALSGDGLCVTARFDDGYPFAQVYAPPGSDFACLEPMTAPTNALVSGRFHLVPPGGSFAARFSVVVTEGDD